MRAAILQGRGAPSVLKIKNVKAPSYGSKDLLIKVQYSSVNPLDVKVRSGGMRIPFAFTKILGFDVCGKVQRVGRKVSGFEVGDLVCGLIGRKAGAHAELMRISAKNCVKIPDSFDPIVAGVIPAVSLTAYKALHDIAKVQKSDKVIIIGASGGVGHIAAQLAKLAKADVTAVCSSKNKKFVESLDPNKVVCYDKEEIPKDADVIFDVSGKYNPQHFNASRIFISTLPTASRLVRSTFSKSFKLVFVGPNKSNLETIVNLVQEKKLKIKVNHEFVLSQIREAHKTLEDGTIGKISLRIS